MKRSLKQTKASASAINALVYGDKEHPNLGPTADEYAHSDMTIPKDALLGITWKSDSGDTYKTVGRYHRGTGKRIVRMKLSSYTEIGSFGAMHWYGSLRVDVDTISNEDRRCTHGGYLGKSAPNKHTQDISMRARRVIRAGERNALGRSIGKRGEETERLDTKEQARELTIAMFRKRFGPGWILINDTVYYGDEEEIIAET